VTKQAVFGGKTYSPPVPLNVDSGEDPDLPDVKVVDGLCEDANGKCSLRAAIQQAGFTSGTDAARIEIPAATYLLDQALSLNMAPTGNVHLHGTDPATTVIDGRGTVDLLRLASESGIVSVENLTFQNGTNSASRLGSPTIAPYVFHGTL